MIIVPKKQKSTKIFDNLSKYKDLEIEITAIIPAVVRTPGMIKKNTELYIKKIPGNLSLFEIQNIVLMNTP